MNEEKRRDLSKSNNSLQHINRDLEQFAYITSHDLQEPVRKIMVYADRVRERNSSTLDDVSNTFIDKIILSAGRMQSLIREVLNYSMNANRPDNFIPTDLNRVLDEVLSDLELRIEQKNASIERDKLPVAEVIPTQLAQLFYNIIGNSLKFSTTAGRPSIRITAGKVEYASGFINGKGKNYFEIVFSDNGIGFGQDFITSIFSPFQRSQEALNYEGSGIGLAICKKIVNNHGGEIFAESALGVGTTIHIILPLEH